MYLEFIYPLCSRVAQIFRWGKIASCVDQKTKREKRKKMHSEQRVTSSTGRTQRLFTGPSYESMEHDEKINTFKDHMISRSHRSPAISTQLGEVLAIRCFDMLPLAPGPTSSLLSVGVKRGQADWEHCCYWAQQWEVHGGWCVCVCVPTFKCE